MARAASSTVRYANTSWMVMGAPPQDAGRHFGAFAAAALAPSRPARRSTGAGPDAGTITGWAVAVSMYAIKEIFHTLQGEGFHAGRPAVFCRFSGCNLWSG